MAMVSIRSAEVGDAAAIAHVHVQSWLTTYEGIVPAEYLASLDEGERTLRWRESIQRDVCIQIAELEGVVVGFASGGPVREALGEYGAELYAIYLVEEAQGRGIGRELMSAVASTLLAKGFSSMVVWVLEQNRAVSFYEKSGAQYLERKQIEIGGASLVGVALGWLDLRQLLS